MAGPRPEAREPCRGSPVHQLETEHEIERHRGSHVGGHQCHRADALDPVPSRVRPRQVARRAEMHRCCANVPDCLLGAAFTDRGWAQHVVCAGIEGIRQSGFRSPAGEPRTPCDADLHDVQPERHRLFLAPVRSRPNRRSVCPSSDGWPGGLRAPNDGSHRGRVTEAARLNRRSVAMSRLHHGEPSSAAPSRSARHGATPSRGPRSLGVDAVVPAVRRVEAGAAAPASGAAKSDSRGTMSECGPDSPRLPAQPAT